MSKYTLPDLTYDYGALAPHISGKIMELHHDKHHLAYVNGANSALDAMEEARAAGNLVNIN
jgi:Fe-Mn family superoxide dismutase